MADANAHRTVDAGVADDGRRRNPLDGLFDALPDLSLQESLANIIADNNLHLNRHIQIAYSHAQSILRDHLYLTLEEVTALVLYTMEGNPRERSVYFMMNAVLRAQDRDLVKPWKHYIYLLLKALRKIPPADDHVVFRGMRGTTLGDLGRHYQSGQTFQLASFTSTTASLGVMNRFVGSNGDRVILHLTLNESVARDIRPFSMFESERELLMPPNMMFRVDSIFDAGNGLYQLHCIQTPTLDELISYTYQAPTITIEDVENAVASGNFALLASYCTSTQSDIVFAVASALHDLSTLQAFIDAVSENRIIPALVSILRDSSDDAKSPAARALGNLANIADLRQLIHDAGATPLLVLLLRRDGPDDAKSPAAFALGNLALNADLRWRIHRAEATALFVSLLRDGPDDAKSPAAFALGNLALNADLRWRIHYAGAHTVLPLWLPRDYGVTGCLVSLLRDGSDDAKRNAACALGNLALNESLRQLIRDAGAVALLDVIVREGPNGAKSNASFALRNINSGWCTISSWWWVVED